MVSSKQVSHHHTSHRLLERKSARIHVMRTWYNMYCRTVDVIHLKPTKLTYCICGVLKHTVPVFWRLGCLNLCSHWSRIWRETFYENNRRCTICRFWLHPHEVYGQNLKTHQLFFRSFHTKPAVFTDPKTISRVKKYRTMMQSWSDTQFFVYKMLSVTALGLKERDVCLCVCILYLIDISKVLIRFVSSSKYSTSPCTIL